MRSILDLKRPIEKPVQFAPSKGVVTEVKYLCTKPKDWDDVLWQRWLVGLGKYYQAGKFRVSINHKGEIVINRYRWELSKVGDDYVFFKRGSGLIKAYIDRATWNKITHYTEQPNP